MTRDEAIQWMKDEQLRPYLTPVTNVYNWTNLRNHNFRDLELGQHLFEELVKKNRMGFGSLEVAEEAMIELLMRYRPKKKRS